jgi:hypothetical protein
MSNKQRIALINRAYAALEFLDDIKMSKPLSECYRLAWASESSYRRTRSGKAHCTVAVAARSFVVRWIAQYAHEPHRLPSIGGVLALRPDVIMAAALVANYRDRILKAFSDADLDLQIVAAIDYCKLIDGED